VTKKLFAIILFFLCIILSLDAENEKPFTFVVFGDSGCGCEGQQQVANRLKQWYSEKPFNVVLMVGDNIYAKDSRRKGGSRELFEERFDHYYDPLLQKGVKFYAVLGNHDLETNGGIDEIADRSRFNIGSTKGYYTFTPDVKAQDRSLVTFIGLNSPSLDRDREQAAWLSRVLTDSNAIWEIPFFHHPIYTCPGKHEEEVEIRTHIEKILIAAGVKVTFAGHNHFYARMKALNGIIHFVTGGGGRSLVTPEPDQNTAEARKSFHFMYWEVYADRLIFWTVPPTGPPFDTGTILLGPAS
jgi:Calcineurin-like phosphoesterase